MSIRVTCPSCGGVLIAPDAAAGKRGKCAKCKSPVRIPSPSGVSPPPPIRIATPLPATPVAREYDVEVLDDFDVDVLPERPAAPTVPQAPPAPAARPAPVPAPVHNPFATFGPPPDSAAARLQFDDSSSDAASRLPPLHSDWDSVTEGLSSLQRSATIGLAAVGLGAFGSVASALQAPILLYVVGGLGFLTAIVALIFHVIGLVRCLKMPQPEEGGTGRGLVMTSLILTVAGIVLTPCFGVGTLALAAIPFVLGTFLRGIGQILAHRTTLLAANRSMFASGAAILAGLVAPLAMFIIVPVMRESGSSKNSITLLMILVSIFSSTVYFVAVYLYLIALGHGERAVRSAIRGRGTRSSSFRSTREVSRFTDHDSPTPRPDERPSKPRSQRSTTDDYNPFA